MSFLKIPLRRHKTEIFLFQPCEQSPCLILSQQTCRLARFWAESVILNAFFHAILPVHLFKSEKILFATSSIWQINLKCTKKATHSEFSVALQLIWTWSDTHRHTHECGADWHVVYIGNRKRKKKWHRKRKQNDRGESSVTYGKNKMERRLANLCSSVHSYNTCTVHRESTK